MGLKTMQGMMMSERPASIATGMVDSSMSIGAPQALNILFTSDFARKKSRMLKPQLAL